MTAALRDYTLDDDARADVDYRAVEFACNGTRMKLGRNERIEAVRLMAGKHLPKVIAERIGSYTEEIAFILKSLGAVKCPLCKRHSLHVDGVLNRHIDVHGIDFCPMSGKRYDDRDFPARWRRQQFLIGSRRYS